MQSLFNLKIGSAALVLFVMCGLASHYAYAQQSAGYSTMLPTSKATMVPSGSAGSNNDQLCSDLGTGTNAKTNLSQPLLNGGGIFWLGALLGYFLVYSVNVGSAASDAFKSFVGIVGIGSGGLLALLPTSSPFEVASKLAEATLNLSNKLNASAGEQAYQFHHLSRILEKAACDSEAFQQSLPGIQLLSTYAHGALLGFGVYILVSIILAAVYICWPTNKRLNNFAYIIAKTILGENFAVPATDAPSDHA